MSERERRMDEKTVREEHLKSVSERNHWLYLFGVLLGGLALMLAFVALLGAGGG